MRTPLYVDVIPVVPLGARPGPETPLTRHASADELRTTTAIDPVVGDQISCAELRDRDRACWAEADRRWPPRQSHKLDEAERERASAARDTCRCRRWVLLRVCKVSGVRAG